MPRLRTHNTKRKKLNQADASINCTARVLFLNGLFIIVASIQVYAQQSGLTLEQRVEKLENYTATIQPGMIDLSNELNASIQEYTTGLEKSLENYSRKLQINLEERLKDVDRETVLLNPYTNSYQSIETNTGIFLIAVEKMEPIDNGFRLYLNIGNPNYADYQNFKLKFFWGNRWRGEQVVSYGDWRQSLKGAEFDFTGKLEKGMWNSLTVDLIPAGGSQLSYLECEMNVSAIELGFK